MLLPLEQLLHMLLIAPPVGLRAQRVDGGTLAEIQHPILDAAGVRRLSHLAAERVQLPHEMTLARPADCGIAWHIPHGVEIDREHGCAQPQPCTGKARLDPGMSRADHRNIIVSRIKFHSGLLGFLK